MSSISHRSERGLSPALSESIPHRMRVISGDVNLLFPVGHVILFDQSPNDFHAHWNDADDQLLSAVFVPQDEGLGLLGGSATLAGFLVKVGISQVQDQPSKWQGVVTPIPDPNTGPSGTFVAQADPDPEPDPPL